jgi:glycosyltransferase involved in cell wall biosynthesis
MIREERRLTIGFDGRYLRDSCFGLGRYACGLLHGLSRVDGNHRLIVFVDPTAPNTHFSVDRLAHSEKVEFRHVSWRLHDPRELWFWRSMIYRTGIDLFHTPYFLSPIAVPCPVVATVHDMIYDRFPEFLPYYTTPLARGGMRLQYRLASRFALRHAAGLIAVSEATRADIREFTGIDADKITVVSEGVDPAFRPVLTQSILDRVRARYQLPASYVLAVYGSRRPHKNIHRLVEAFAHLPPEVSPHLVLVGNVDPMYVDVAEKVIVALRRVGRLIEIRHLEERDLPAVYSMATFLMQPSISEGFGLPVVEAMSCGCPVACSDVAALREVAGTAALYFDPLYPEMMTTVMQRLICSDGLRERLRREGLQRAKAFTWERAARETLKLYQAVAGV